ncbi:MAG TPA: hypothetical protein PLN94_04370, partial [Thiolinea sp.]|nr:hypothetical protein [Thiolinea sp.]
QPLPTPLQVGVLLQAIEGYQGGLSVRTISRMSRSPTQPIPVTCCQTANSVYYATLFYPDA